MNSNDDGSRISKITKQAHKLKSTLGTLGDKVYGKLSHPSNSPHSATPQTTATTTAAGNGGYSSGMPGYQQPTSAGSVGIQPAVSNPYVNNNQNYQPSSLTAMPAPVPYSPQNSRLNKPFTTTSDRPTATAVNPYQNSNSHTRLGSPPPNLQHQLPSAVYQQQSSQISSSASSITSPSPSTLSGAFAPTAPPSCLLPTSEYPTEEDLQPGNHIVSDLPLAEGAQGALYRAFSLDNERVFVIKRMKFKTVSEKETAEIWAWNFKVNVSHVNIIKYLSVGSTSPLSLDISMPIYSDGDLEKYIRNAPSAVSQDVIISFCCQISSALRYLHTLSSVSSSGRYLVHRDLKPANVLLTDNSTRCIIIDFDSWGRAGKTDQETTYEFLAPETITREESTPSSDMWSLGAIMFCLLTLPSFPMLIHPSGESVLLNHESWGTADLEEQIKKETPNNYCPHLVHLTSRLLNHDIRLRPTAEQTFRYVELTSEIKVFF